MGDQQREGKQAPGGKKKAAVWKIAVPILIVAAIAGIYIAKNAGNVPAPGSSASQPADPAGADYGSDEFALDATESLDMEKLLSYGLPVVIDFGADECVPCRQMAPVLKELNAELRGKAVVKFVDVWKNTDAAKLVPLSAIPTQFFFNADGSPYVPKDAEAAKAQGFAMYSTRDAGEHVFTAHVGGMDKDAILAVLAEMGVE